jgi:hypothetical protein
MAMNILGFTVYTRYISEGQEKYDRELSVALVGGSREL